MSLMSLTAVALGKKIQAGEVTVEEAVLDALEQIEKKEDTIHSYVTVLEKEAILEKAKEIQKKIDAGELTGPLWESRWQSKIICVPRACLQHAVPRFYIILCQRIHRKQ